MNTKDKITIKNKVKNIKLNKKEIFFNNYKIYEYDIFKKKLNSKNFVIKCINQISSGSVIILRNSIDPKFLDKMKTKLNEILKKKKPISPKVKTGIKNGYYISKQLSSKGYKTVDKSFYFFSWNQDPTGIYKKVINIYKPLKILNGLSKNEITKNKPVNGIIERVHVINYPLNSGLISQHYDPINVTIFNFGIYATEYGEDYDSGGFFVLNKNKKKIFFDKKIKKNDAVIFFPSLIHGVDKVKKIGQTKSDGRWFVNVNLAQSHEVKNREYTKKF